MALIKSALELALERTKSLEVDEFALRANEAKTEGRRTAGKFLDSPEEVDIAAAIQNAPAETREHFRKAIFEVLAGQIQLPSGPFSEERIIAVTKGLAAVARFAESPESAEIQGNAEQSVLAIMNQVGAFYSKYLSEMKRVEQVIRDQWAPKLKEKERQVSSRLGQDVRLDPMADPEFAKFYKQNIEALRQNYSDALERAKEQITLLCGF